MDPSPSISDQHEEPVPVTALSVVRSPRRVEPRTRLGVFFLVCAALLAAWTVWLTVRLPERHVVGHWDAAWGGFDVMLMIAIVALGLALLRRSPRAHWSAIVVSTLLVVDAWFDITTASGHAELMRSVLLACIVELPLAGYCLSIAIRGERSGSAARDERP